MAQSLTKDQLSQLCSSTDIQAGQRLMDAGAVTAFEETLDEDKFELSCHVRDRRDYEVSLSSRKAYFGIQVEGDCSCGHRKNHPCRHIAAALLTHIGVSEHPELFPNCQIRRVTKTNEAARKLLNVMRRDHAGVEAGEASAPEALARLVPVLTPPAVYENRFQISLKVGYDKPYVVKDISDFLRMVDARESHGYGKKLTLNHAIENFDETSRGLIDFIRRMVDAMENGHQQGNYPGYHTDLRLSGSLYLSERLFKTHYDYLSTLPMEDRSGKPILLLRGDPKVRAEFSRQDGMVLLRAKPEDNWQVIGENDLFCQSGNSILLTSEGFGRDIAPLLENAGSLYQFTFKDMPAFCSLVLPRIQDGVDIVDPDGVLAEYMPDECVPRFYFDMQDGVLSCRLVFHYPDQDIRYGQQQAAGRRDIRAEDAVVRALKRDFSEMNSRHDFIERDEGKAMDFLCGPIDAYRDRGEVFLSDRLSRQEFTPTRASVGVSVSDGMLSLSFDMGGFPPEELEALYQSLLTRRKYHKMKDGRFMRLQNDGSGLEALAETAHMTQISSAQLKDGEVKLPAYRALYLDSVLDKREGLRVKRNEQFRDMVRRFKTVEDSDYQLPEGVTGELRPYQETGYRWLKTLESCHFGGILADEMGLGKTLQTIAYFTSKPFSETGKPHLVACPASLVLNWQDEMTRFAPGLKVRLITGTLKQRREQLAEKTDDDVWVTSYDLLKRDIELYNDHAFYAFVLDEGQFVKNQSTKASKAVKQINCQQRFVLTGTPVENRLSELWNLFDFLMPGYLFGHQRFVERLEKPIVQKGDAEARQQLNRLVRPFILRRLKKDVLKELPDKIEHVRRIQLSEEERKVYHAQSMAALQQLEGTQEKIAILAALTRLRQICCDPNLCFENYEGETSKLEACLELVQSMAENGHQILLFSQFTAMLDRIRPLLDRAGITSYTLQGSTPREERARLVKEFNRGGAQVFLISLKAGGTGLNLTAADVVIHYDPWWNIAAQNQATDRAHRIGQEHCVNVYKLIASDTVEERILELQNRKAELLDAVTENAGEDIMKMSQEDLMALIRDDG